MNLKTRTAGQTMVINARRRLGMKTTPQPEVKAVPSAATRPARRMRSKGPPQQEGSRPGPCPGGDPPDHPSGHGRLPEADGRGGPSQPPGLPLRRIQEAPQGTLAMMVEDEVDLMSLMRARLLIRTRTGAHHGSKVELQIRMVIMIAMHVSVTSVQVHDNQQVGQADS